MDERKQLGNSTKKAARTTAMFFYSQTDDEPCMTRAEAAADLRVSERTFDKLLPGIPHFRLGRRILIRKSQLRSWLEKYRVSPNDSDLQRFVDEAVESVLGPPNQKEEK